MDIFKFRDFLIHEYESFSRSFTKLKADDIKTYLKKQYDSGVFWPEPLIQLNPSFVSSSTVEDLVKQKLLHQECAKIFRAGKNNHSIGSTLTLYKHQEEAIHVAIRNESYVLTTHTGSGKSLSYFIPIVNYILRERNTTDTQPRVQAIIIYPMNALANSQCEELMRFLSGTDLVRFARYTGQESQEKRQAIAKNPPDIVLTNFMMLELMMTRQDPVDKAIIRAAEGFKFLVLDELHTYRGRQGADVAMLIRRIRATLNPDLLCIGTSATMATEGTLEERNAIVAKVASKLFGATVKPENVVTETLQRATVGYIDERALRSALEKDIPSATSYTELQKNPLAIWIELNLGLKESRGKWVRHTPTNLQEAAEKLSKITGIDIATCRQKLGQFLLLAYHTKQNSYDNRSRLFVFRLHQFISGSGDLFATIEPEGKRYLDIRGQQFQPGHANKRLFNVAFCRECGQEYFPVWARGEKTTATFFEPRELSDKNREDYKTDEKIAFGFLMPCTNSSQIDLFEKYPEEWIDFTRAPLALKVNFKRYRPIPLGIAPSGEVSAEGMETYFIPGTFRFCLHCGKSYDGSMRSDLSKLSSLSSEGRSSATTVLTLSAMRYLREQASDLEKSAKKLLAFTDNRQDAALQAGHFNDFIQVLSLRGALLAAIEVQGQLTDEVLAQAVHKILALEKFEFMANPEANFWSEEQAQKTLKDVLGYRLYHDLQEGWRITNPNLEQLSLLKIDYQGLDTVCAETALWQNAPALLAQATADIRKKVATKLLDYCRHQLCIKTRYLEVDQQEQLRQASFNHLRDPWAISEENERFKQAHHLIVGSKPTLQKQQGYFTYLSFRSRLGREIGQPSFWANKTFSSFPKNLDKAYFEELIHALLNALMKGGFINVVDLSGGKKGYQLNAGTLLWRLPQPEEIKQKNTKRYQYDNSFFANLYKNVAQGLLQNHPFLQSLKAREHTAQVDSGKREEREKAFREANLPILFCSPTMELGIDIADLNMVYMRNTPPTPANYAQRSGRAGRSGQPALVLTYCAAKSPHDQYYFADPVRMVAGSVTPPLLDLTNEDLITSHLHAVWLAQTGQKLAPRIGEILQIGENNQLSLREELAVNMDNARVQEHTYEIFLKILTALSKELTPESASWYTSHWLTHMVQQAFKQFDSSLARWRDLYRSAIQQINEAHAVLINAATTPKEREDANNRHKESVKQRDLLLDPPKNANSDFETYRYLATQGFLPGYNFPRLPLIAFMPSHRQKSVKNACLTRPRFLGISEFGPRSIIYHEGGQYIVQKMIIGINESSLTHQGSSSLGVYRLKICSVCGYGHFRREFEMERCVACHNPLVGSLCLFNLYHVENVSARLKKRITSNEEERMRQGYEMLTTFQYAKKNNAPQVINTTFSNGDAPVLTASYGPSATLWRMNLGWRWRKEKSIYGFNVDSYTGTWAKDPQAPEEQEVIDEGKSIERVVPFVEDRRNILVLRLDEDLSKEAMVTLQYMLKRGIEVQFQLEESELAVELLPNADTHKTMLFYESAEGGAGVLTKIANDPNALADIAKKALKITHFTLHEGPQSAKELIKQDQDKECEAGCYRCLLSYRNQSDHRFIQRKNEAVLTLLCRLMEAKARRGTEGRTAEEQFDELFRLCDSPLEKKWLTLVNKQGFRLPDKAQYPIHQHMIRPDFIYTRSSPALIFIDGPHHETDYQSSMDEVKNRQLRDAGYEVIRFAKDEKQWADIFKQYPDVFGVGVTQ